MFLLAVIVFAPLAFYIYNFNFYNKLYENNGVYDTIDRNDAKKLTLNVFDYFKNKRDFEQFELKNGISFFNASEISHLKDVRSLLSKIFIIFYICLLLFFIMFFLLFEKSLAFFIKNISIVFVASSSAMIFILLTLYLFGSNFISLFENFHHIFFPQGNWSFPEGSLIITIFPFGFFYDFFFRLLLSSMVLSIILLFTGITGIILSNWRLRKRLNKAGK